MKLSVASLQGNTHGTLVEETKLLSYSIQQKFNEPAVAIITLSDPTGSLLQKYRAVPTVQCVAKDGAVYTTETTAGNNDTIDDMHLMPADQAGAAVDAYFFGFDGLVGGLRLHITQAAVWLGWPANPVWTWKYSQGGGVWANLADVVDDTTRFTVAGTNAITWTVPGDWATDTVNGISGKYWVQAYVSTSGVTTTQPLGGWVSSGIYMGPGRAVIEDPTDTPIFDGRIARLETDTEKFRLSLICYDWLDQLNEEMIDYDMREDLNGSGLRQSGFTSEVTSATVGYPVRANAGVFTAYDRGAGITWAGDEFNGKYLVIPNSMAGSQTVKVGPYSDTVAPAVDHEIWGAYGLWGASIGHWTDDDDAPWTVTYKYRLYVPRSSKYVSISAAKVNLSYHWLPGTNAACTISFYNHSTTAYVLLDTLRESDDYVTQTLTIPAIYLTPAILTDANGEAWIQFDITGVVDFTLLVVNTLTFEVDVTTTGYSSVVDITDTAQTATVGTLTVDTDLSLAGVGLWEGCPYAICKEIYKHLHTGLGTLITDGDTLKALTCDGTIEHTSGISTRHYSDRTRLEIMQDLARMDRASFWATLGGVIVNWKQTFNDGAPTALTDASVLQWGVMYDYHTMKNNYRIYGVRIGDTQLVTDSDDLSPDPGAMSKSVYKATRGEVVSSAGMVSEADTIALAGRLATRDDAPPLFLNAKFPGLSTLRLGSEVAITSTRLGLTTAYYVVSKWTYDSNAYRTEVELSPRSSVGFTDRFEFADRFRQMDERGRTTERDSYRPGVYSTTWT